MKRSRTWWALVIGFFSIGSFASAQLPSNFTLGKYVPDDCWMFMHFAHNPQSEWITEEWTRVWNAFRESNVASDALKLVLSFIPDHNRQEAEAAIDKITTLLNSVAWGDLASLELAFGERVSDAMPGYDYILLARGAPGSGSRNRSALANILKEIAALSGSARLVPQSLEGMEAWTLILGTSTTPGKPNFRATLFGRDDVVALVTGKQSTSQVIGLMTGATESRPIVDSDRFRRAVAEQPAPADGVMFFDMRRLAADLASLLKRVRALVADAPSPGVDRVPEVLVKALDRCNIVDYVIVSVETKDRRQLTHTVTRMQGDRLESPFARTCLDRKPFDPYDRYIPAKATSFSLGGFINMQHAYEMVLAFIRDEVPDGATAITRWQQLLESVGFDPQRDLFSWWSGEYTSFTMPAAVVTPFSREDSVLMFRVKDAALASQKVNAAVDSLAALLKSHGQMLIVQPAKIKAEGFREVTHPLLLGFMIRPVIGVADDWLMIGSSAAAVEQSLTVSRGDAPSVRTNERFQREGLVPTGPVSSLSFKDTSRFGDELAEAFASLGMVGQMIPMFTAGAFSGNSGSPEAAKAIEGIQKLFGLLTKLAPVAQKIDFFSSESTTSLCDKGVCRETRVVTYKPASFREKADSLRAGE